MKSFEFNFTKIGIYILSILLASGLIILLAFTLPINKLIEALENQKINPTDFSSPPSINLASAIKVLPENKDLAIEKLEKLSNALTPTNEARRLYILGQIAQRNSRFEEALNYYSQIPLRALPYLADRVLLHKAEINAELGREKLVMNSCRDILRNYPNSLSFEAAHYELARSYLRQSNFPLAQKGFQFIINKFPNSNYAIGSTYYLGQMQDNNVSARNQLWEKYLSKSPDGRFADEITDIWLKEGNLSSQQKVLIGLNYFYKNKKPDDNQKLSDLLSAEISELNWLVLGKTYLKEKQKSLAQKTLLNGLKTFTDDDNFRIALNLLFTNSSKEEINNFAQVLLASDNLSTENKAFIYWRLAAFNKAERKKNLYNLLQKYPNSYWSPSTANEIFWDMYKSGNQTEAIKLGQNLIIQYANYPEMAKVLFWLGKSAELAGENTQAQNYYAQILKSHIDNYYAFRAKERLKALRGGIDQGWHLKNFSMINNSIDLKNWDWSLPKEEIQFLNPTIKELLSLNLWQEAISLLSNNYDKQYPALQAWLKIKVENAIVDGIKIASDQIYKQKPTLNAQNDYWKLSYPLIYFEYTQESALKNNFNPFLLQALMRQESRFQPKVISTSKAYGLCQLLMGTAKEVAKSVNLPSPTTELLMTPAYNINLGSKYLGDLIKRFDGQAQLAVAAYNAGPGSVSKWQKASTTQDPDMFIESIPYEETRKYVINVFENYWIYENLFGAKSVAVNYAQ